MASYTGMPKYWRVAEKCANCGYRPSYAGELTSSMFFRCPECGHDLTPNPQASATIDMRTSQRSATPPESTTRKLMPPSPEPTYLQRFSLPAPLAWVLVIVAVVLAWGVYVLVETYGLAQVAFTTGAAIVIFALTTIAIATIIESKRYPWLAGVAAPLAAAMFAIMFWYLLLGNPFVDELIQRLMGSYIGVISTVITIIAGFLAVWLLWKRLRAYVGKE